MARYRLPNAAYRKASITLPKEFPVRTPRNYHQVFPTKLPLRTPTVDPHRTPRRFTHQNNIGVSDPHHFTHRSLSRIPTGSRNSAQTRVTFHHKPHASAKGPHHLPTPLTSTTDPLPGPRTHHLSNAGAPFLDPRERPANLHRLLHHVRGSCKGAHNYFRFWQRLPGTVLLLRRPSASAPRQTSGRPPTILTICQASPF